MDIRAADNAAARYNLPAILRSLQKPNAIKFAAYMASQTTASTILAPDGNPMGNVIETDRDRVNHTGEHIIRGLYYVETRTPLPPDAILKIASKAGLTSSSPDILTIARTFSVMPDHRSRDIGTSFSYVAAFGGGVSFWLTLLYDYFFWAGTIDCRATAPTVSGGVGR
jgi:hypothetical protein